MLLRLFGFVFGSRRNGLSGSFRNIRAPVIFARNGQCAVLSLPQPMFDLLYGRAAGAKRHAVMLVNDTRAERAFSLFEYPHFSRF